jgi:hypothetical protein
MNIKTYPDGSVFTGKHLAGALAGGAVGATLLTIAMLKKEERFYKKVRKNYKN